MMKWLVLLFAILAFETGAYAQTSAGLQSMGQRVDFDIAAKQSSAWEHAPASKAISGGKHVIDVELQINEARYDRDALPVVMFGISNADMSKTLRLSFAAYEDRPTLAMFVDKLSPNTAPDNFGDMPTTFARNGAVKLRIIVMGDRVITLETTDGSFPIPLDFEPKRLVIAVSGVKGWAAFTAISDDAPPLSLSTTIPFDQPAGKAIIADLTSINQAIRDGERRVRATVVLDEVRQDPAGKSPPNVAFFVYDREKKNRALVVIWPPAGPGRCEMSIRVVREDKRGPASKRVLTGVRAGEPVVVTFDFDASGSMIVTVPGYATVVKHGFLSDSMGISAAGIKGAVEVALVR